MHEERRTDLPGKAGGLPMGSAEHPRYDRTGSKRTSAGVRVSPPSVKTTARTVGTGARELVHMVNL